MIRRIFLPLVLFLSAAFPVCAAFGIKPDGHLDIPVLRKAYMESDFEKVQASLEGFLKKHPSDVLRDEKVFTHMYLGVIYAADTNTQVKAESHFNSLLSLSPHIEPIDMFVPPKIQDLFDRIKKDFLKRTEYERNYDAFGNPIGRKQDTLSQKTKDSDGKGSKTDRNLQTGKVPAVASGSDHAWVWWTLGSAAAIAAGAGYFALTADADEPAPKRTVVDGTLK